MTDASANPCPICGQAIAERPRGSRHGHPPKTCSEACRKERTRRIERARYHAVKGSEQWKATRMAYRAKLQQRLDTDPEFYAIFRAYAAARVRSHRASIAAGSDRHEQLKAASRAHYRQWRAELESDPAAWEAHKAKCRAWYASLSPQERDRIYNEPRKRESRGNQ